MPDAHCAPCSPTPRVPQPARGPRRWREVRTQPVCRIGTTSTRRPELVRVHHSAAAVAHRMTGPHTGQNPGADPSSLVPGSAAGRNPAGPSWRGVRFVGATSTDCEQNHRPVADVVQHPQVDALQPQHGTAGEPPPTARRALQLDVALLDDDEGVAPLLVAGTARLPRLEPDRATPEPRRGPRQEWTDLVVRHVAPLIRGPRRPPDVPTDSAADSHRRATGLTAGVPRPRRSGRQLTPGNPGPAAP